MSITASHLRQNIYKLLDRVIKTGQPLEVERKGQKLKIIRAERLSRLNQLPKRRCIKGDPESLVISPIVLLELQYLYESGRITEEATLMLETSALVEED